MFEEKSAKVDILLTRLRNVESKRSSINSELSQCLFDMTRLKQDDDAKKATELLDCIVSLEQMRHNQRQQSLTKSNALLRRQLESSRYS
jgi:hypothetical protein